MNYLNEFPQVSSVFIYILFIWALVWKGFALWRAAKNEQKNWFIALLVINSIGILDIVYLFRFAKKRLTFGELKTWVLRK